MADGSDRSKTPEVWKPRKREQRQSYYNIAVGATIGIIIFVVSLTFGWVAKMQIASSKADRALEEVARNSKAMQSKGKIVHTRIEKNEDFLIEVVRLLSAVNERSKMNSRDIEIMEIKTR